MSFYPRSLLIVAVCLVIPIVWLWTLWGAVSLVDWLFACGVYGLLVASFYLIAPWDVVGYYLRYVVGVIAGGAAIASTFSVRALPVLPRDRHEDGSWLHLVVSLLLITWFGRSLIRVARGHTYHEEPVRLAFPLRGGRYYIAHGGSDAAINYHVVNRAQRYAVDIVKLDRLGLRARGLQPRDPCMYHIFSDTLYSPCDGMVVAAVDGLPDLAPPAMDRERVAGNHVVVEPRQQGVKILLAHMRSGSVAVKAGDCVACGQPLGRVGNSGRTSEPHLHIHAERGGEADRWGSGTGAPILFDGRFPTRNDTFVA